MPRQTKLHLNHIEHYDSEQPFSGLTFALRTDADHATKFLKGNLLKYFNTVASDDVNAEEKIRHVVHQAYRKWGHTILKALSSAIDYSSYGLDDEQNQFLDAHFYNAKSLANDAVKKGAAMVEQNRGNKKPTAIFYVSLDDMIEPKTAYSGEIAFSRLFSQDGMLQMGYVARPGKPPLEEQLRTVRDIAKSYHKENGKKLSIVLLEDNVRHARMLNWVIGEMEQAGIFKHANLGGVSTCFCCAPEHERKAITWRGRTVPLTCVVDYGAAMVDVVTPRDLLFDGRVVSYKDNEDLKTGRLPGPFMNPSYLFKVEATKQGAFAKKVMHANIKFCKSVECKLGVGVPLEWFAAAPAVTATTKYQPDDRMVYVLKDHGPNP